MPKIPQDQYSAYPKAIPAAITDWNNLLESGTYFVLSGTALNTYANVPVASSGGFLTVTDMGSAGTFMIQRYQSWGTRYSGQLPTAWIRSLQGGTWSAWQHDSIGDLQHYYTQTTAPTTGQTVTAAGIVVSGITTTVQVYDPQSIWSVQGVFDVVKPNTNTDTFLGKLFIDGAEAVGAYAVGVMPTANVRLSLCQNWTITGLSVASHSFQLRAQGDGSNWQIRPHTTMKIDQVR